jgi:invasion protein IalB
MRRLTGRALVSLAWLAAWAACPAVAQETPAAPAEPPATQEEQIQDWTVRCMSAEDGKLSCEMIQILRQRDSGKDVMLMGLGVQPGDTQLVAWIVLPLGVALLPPGVGIKIDEAEPARLAFQYCEPTGCAALWAPTEAELAALKAGTVLTVIVTDRNRKQFGLPISLKGFTAALARVQ